MNRREMISKNLDRIKLKTPAFLDVTRCRPAEDYKRRFHFQDRRYDKQVTSKTQADYSVCVLLGAYI